MVLGKGETLPILEWVFWPGLITLAVTLLRLVGELMGWSAWLFSDLPGGGMALVGIAWLVPVFGYFFGRKLERHDMGPRDLNRATWTFAALLIVSCAVIYTTIHIVGAPPGTWGSNVAFLILTFIVIPLAVQAWPGLGKLLFAYGLAARIPVAVVMLLAIYGSWGTHYDVDPANWPVQGAGPFLKWILIGLLPQLTVWMIYTLIIGGLFGCLAAHFGRRR